MSDKQRLSEIEPIGKSVEEVEEGTQNRVNPPAPDEQRATGDEGATPIMPWGEGSAGVRGAMGGTPSPGIPVIPLVTEDGDARTTTMQDDPDDKR